MKIVYLSDILTLPDFRLLEKVASIHSIFLVTFKDFDIPEEIKNIPGLEIFYFPARVFLFTHNDSMILKVVKTLKNKIEFLKKYICLKSALRQIRPDIIHAGWVQESGYLAALSRFHPFLLMPWGSDILMQPDFSKEQMKITKYTLSRADAIACDCENVKSKIIEILGYDGEKIEIFPWGVDLNRFNPENRDVNFKKKLGFEGRKIVIITRQLEEIYGLNYLLEAIPMVVKSIPASVFVFCGEGMEKEKLKQMAREFDIQDHVLFTGFIDNEKLPHYLNAADLYVSPSLSDGTSISLLEAMACAKPVVVTDVPSNMEWIKDGTGGFIVPRRCPNALAEKIVLLLKDEGLMQRMGRANLEVARQRADWDKNFKKLEKVYERLAG